MNTFKTLLLFTLAGALLGAGIASFVAPGWLVWYNTPANGAQAICDIATITHDTLSKFLRAQLIGASIGAVLLLVVGVLLGRRRGGTTVPVTP